MFASPAGVAALFYDRLYVKVLVVARSGRTVRMRLQGVDWLHQLQALLSIADITHVSATDYEGLNWWMV